MTHGVIADGGLKGAMCKAHNVRHMPPPKMEELSPAESPGLAGITFGFGLPLMRLGAQRPLMQDDVPAICRCDRAEHVVYKTITAWQSEQAVSSRPQFLRAILRLYRGKILQQAIWGLGESVSRIVQPMLLRGFLQGLKEGNPEAMYGYAAALVLASLAQAVIHHQFFYRTMTMGWNLRIGVSGALHWKLLRLRPHTIQNNPSDCFNMLSNDCQRFDMAAPAWHFGWLPIVDIAAVSVFLILEVGLLASLCGLGVTLIITAVMTELGRHFARRRKITARITDERLKLTIEVIQAIMSVKVYCWEDAFLHRIGGIRKREHASIFVRQTMVSFIGAMYFSLAPLACLALFLAYAGQGWHLSLPTVYTALSLILTLKTSVGQCFKMFITTVPELLAAISRFSQFLALPEVSPMPVTLPAPVGGEADFPVLEVRSASFSWPEGSRVLTDVSFQLHRGELLVICGPVGCGKSALLQALLGDLEVDKGSWAFGGSVAYAPQTPWIVAGTLRSNVLLGENPYDAGWYDEVLSACCLKEDIAQLGDLGDETEIGERGVNLSGGQRARVGLARAVFSRSAVALLDDPLAAVDPAVVTHLVRHCLRGPVLSNSAVVLCTHQESVFALADILLLLDASGAVRACGPPKQIATACGLTLAQPVSLDAVDSNEPELSHAEEVEQREQNDECVQKQRANVLVRPEDKRAGSVSLDTYVHYARLAGFGGTTLVSIIFVVSQAALLFSNYWLGVWAEAKDQGRGLYINVFVAMTALAVVTACLRSILFYRSAMHATTTLHANALQSLLKTHLGFFTANPQGRILNRFSGDLGNADELLSQSLHDVLDLGFIALGTTVVVCISVPPMIPSFALIFWYMLRLRRFVVKSMTELKRLDSISRSPVFDFYSASLKGITAIRAFGRQEASQRHIVQLLQRNAQAWFWWFIMNRFLGFRLDVLSAVVVGISAFGGAVLKDFISPELIAFAVVNTINLSGLFQFMVRQTALVESFMTSFERLCTYARLEREPDNGRDDAGPNFPTVGAIAMSGLRMCYRDDLPEVLKGVDFAFAGGIKVGICGRTGSGKSSLFMVLSRLANTTAGTICIDGVNTAQLPLKTLRSCIAWVPQEPSFFSGSLRLNLDPLGMHSDEAIIAALRTVQMAEAAGVEGLEATVAEGGSNFSIGERQLLSLARAVLQHRKILCMDEAFANVDFAIDTAVQAAVRAVADSTGATVLVVAHRMQSLEDSDYVVVMDDGVAVEQGQPSALLKHEGKYAAMVKHAQLQETAFRKQQSSASKSFSACIGCGFGTTMPALQRLVRPISVCQVVVDIADT